MLLRSLLLRAMLYSKHCLCIDSSMLNNKILMMILWALLLQACGQTGPLYMPDSPPPIYVPK